MGVNNAELWNNIGLCCFYSSQYDMAVGCFERALSLCGDEDMADVWYNIGHLGVALGDHGLAYQAFKVRVCIGIYTCILCLCASLPTLSRLSHPT